QARMMEQRMASISVRKVCASAAKKTSKSKISPEMRKRASGKTKSPCRWSSKDGRQGEDFAMRLSVTILESADQPAVPDAVCHLFRNRRCENRYRSFLQTVNVCPPDSRCQVCGIFFSSREATKDLLALSSVSVSPQETHRRRIFLAASASSPGIFALPNIAEEKPPIQANLSRCFRPIRKDWPPPIDSPARARFSGPVRTA